MATYTGNMLNIVSHGVGHKKDNERHNKRKRKPFVDSVSGY